MIGGHQLDLLAQHLAAKLFDRNLGGLDRIFAAIFGKDAGLIVQDVDLDALRRRRRRREQPCGQISTPIENVCPQLVFSG